MKEDFELTSKDKLSLLANQKGLYTWKQLCRYVQKLPYGRNSNRNDFSLVLTEEKGTCSSKHALLQSVADTHQILDVQLVLGIYKMNNKNTPKIGAVLDNKPVEYIPEAHCYLQIDGERKDFTSLASNIKRIENDILEEITIKPFQVARFKVDYHKQFIQAWISKHQIPYRFEEIWKMREICIHNLTSNSY